jgi:NADH-quinone oxidoreductase subunit C
VTPAELAQALRASGRDDVLEGRGEVTLILDRTALLAGLESLRSDQALAFDSLSDIAATDWPGRDPRLWVAYHLYSMPHHHRLRVKVGVSEEDPHVPSVTGSFPTADWLEREVFDFFGVIFDGHPDLRRIELPESWTTFPLRKDHALEGAAVRYTGGAFIPPPDQRDT